MKSLMTIKAAAKAELVRWYLDLNQESNSPMVMVKRINKKK